MKSTVKLNDMKQELSLDDIFTTATADPIKDELVRFFDEKIVKAKLIDDEFERLWQITKEVALAGGKRLRPKLFMLFASAYGFNKIEELLKPALSWELLHISFLIHDDIMDREISRHGQLNVTGRFIDVYNKKKSSIPKARILHHANSAALLSGDLLLAAAPELIENSNLRSDLKSAVLKNLSTAIEATAAGQLLDDQSILEPIDKVNTITIIDKKTAGYSTIGPMLSGAELAQASGAQLKLVAKLGLELGRGFQLADDLIGSFGKEAVSGKSNVNDIYEAKRTRLLQEAYNKSNSAQKLVLESLENLTKPDTALAQNVRQIMIETGAKKSIEDSLQQTYADSISTIKALSIDEAHKAIIQELAHKLLLREV
jgi:geranylgeranyl diphosphate synthase type II